MLEPLGISDVEERVYLALLESPGAGVSALARGAGVAASRVREAITNLESRGLLARVPGKTTRYMPTPPEIAIQSLVVRREEELARVRLVAPELARRLRDTLDSTEEEPVQVISGRDAIVQTFLQLERGATEEFLAFDKPPYASSKVVCNPVQLECLERGVRYRIVYDRDALEMPGQIETLETLIAAGEESRTLPGVPMKLVISDGATGLIPLGSGEAGIQAALLVRTSALLEALKRLFEELWTKAQPILLPGDGDRAVSESSPLSQDDLRILALLTAGMQDLPIAKQLGVSRRTVERRVSRLMELLGARTRFQAALLAREKGWI